MKYYVSYSHQNGFGSMLVEVPNEVNTANFSKFIEVMRNEAYASGVQCIVILSWVEVPEAPQ